ncbi:L28 family ribosomal protein [Patescibacteria group bacterium]
MANRCDRCNKGILRGKKIARARQGLNYRSSKTFKPNLHSFKVIIKGRKKRQKFCTKCLRIVKREQAENSKKQEEILAKQKLSQKKRKNIDKPKKVAKKPKVSRKEAHLEKGKLVLDQVQLEGKKPVSWQQFKAGYPETEIIK